MPVYLNVCVLISLFVHAHLCIAIMKFMISNLKYIFNLIGNQQRSFKVLTNIRSGLVNYNAYMVPFDL